MEVQNRVENPQTVTNNNTQTTQTAQVEIPYDVIPLPSEGVLYPGKKSTIEVEYLTDG